MSHGTSLIIGRSRLATQTPFKARNTAFRLARGTVLVPFVFVFSPSMLIMAPGFT